MLSKELTELLDGLFEGAYVVDNKRQIIYWNDSSERISGFSKDDVLHSFCYNNLLKHVDNNGNQLCMNGCPLLKTIQTGVIQENKVYLHHKEGHRVPVVVRTSPLYNDEGDIIAALEVFTDARYRRNLYSENRRLHELTTKDDLTGAFNRKYVDHTIKSQIDEFNTFTQPFGVAFVDIDNFKNINDTYGHKVGDEVLKLLARTIMSNIREEDVFGRYGGEEFVLVLKLQDKEQLVKVADKLRVLVQNSSINVNEEVIHITISVGVTMYNENDDVSSVISRADKAMYQSKQTGKNKVTLL